VTTGNRKAAFGAAFFFFYSLFLEYQVRVDLLPDWGGYFGGEVLLYQGLLLWSGGEGA
jgi:hypothetical protein